MGSFKEQIKIDPKFVYENKQGNEDFFALLKQWKDEYSRQQLEFYSAEFARFQTSAGQTPQPINQNQPVEEPNVYYEYVLPPVWKRFCAEVIDFLILMVVKLYLAYMFIEFFNGVEISDKNIDLQNYWEHSRELVLLEIVSRILVCFYETYWLKGEPSATPGKKCMGLKVYKATNVLLIQEHPKVIVRARPCTELGWQYAIMRAVLKNTIVGLFMFPICLAFLFVSHNRTGYDMLTSSLVVEDNPNPPRHEIPM